MESTWLRSRKERLLKGTSTNGHVAPPGDDDSDPLLYVPKVYQGQAGSGFKFDIDIPWSKAEDILLAEYIAWHIPWEEVPPKLRRKGYLRTGTECRERWAEIFTGAWEKEEDIALKEVRNSHSDGAKVSWENVAISMAKKGFFRPPKAYETHYREIGPCIEPAKPPKEQNVGKNVSESPKTNGHAKNVRPKGSDEKASADGEPKGSIAPSTKNWSAEADAKLKSLVKRRAQEGGSWEQVAQWLQEEHSIYRTSDSCRQRYRRLIMSGQAPDIYEKRREKSLPVRHGRVTKPSHDGQKRDEKKDAGKENAIHGASVENKRKFDEGASDAAHQPHDANVVPIAVAKDDAATDVVVKEQVQAVKDDKIARALKESSSLLKGATEERAKATSTPAEATRAQKEKTKEVVKPPKAGTQAEKPVGETLKIRKGRRAESADSAQKRPDAMKKRTDATNVRKETAKTPTEPSKTRKERPNLYVKNARMPNEKEGTPASVPASSPDVASPLVVPEQKAAQAIAPTTPQRGAATRADPLSATKKQTAVQAKASSMPEEQTATPPDPSRTPEKSAGNSDAAQTTPNPRRTPDEGTASRPRRQIALRRRWPTPIPQVRKGATESTATSLGSDRTRGNVANGKKQTIKSVQLGRTEQRAAAKTARPAVPPESQVRDRLSTGRMHSDGVGKDKLSVVSHVRESQNLETRHTPSPQRRPILEVIDLVNDDDEDMEAVRTSPIPGTTVVAADAPKKEIREEPAPQMLAKDRSDLTTAKPVSLTFAPQSSPFADPQLHPSPSPSVSSPLPPPPPSLAQSSHAPLTSTSAPLSYSYQRTGVPVGQYVVQPNDVAGVKHVTHVSVILPRPVTGSMQELQHKTPSPHTLAVTQAHPSLPLTSYQPLPDGSPPAIGTQRRPRPQPQTYSISLESVPFGKPSPPEVSFDPNDVARASVMRAWLTDGYDTTQTSAGAVVSSQLKIDYRLLATLQLCPMVRNMRRESDSEKGYDRFPDLLEVRPDAVEWTRQEEANLVSVCRSNPDASWLEIAARMKGCGFNRSCSAVIARYDALRKMVGLPTASPFMPTEDDVQEDNLPSLPESPAAPPESVVTQGEPPLVKEKPLARGRPRGRPRGRKKKQRVPQRWTASEDEAVLRGAEQVWRGAQNWNEVVITLEVQGFFRSAEECRIRAETLRDRHTGAEGDMYDELSNDGDSELSDASGGGELGEIG